MDIDVMTKQITHLNLAVFGHMQGATAAAEAAGALNARGKPFTGMDVEKLLRDARSPFALASAPDVSEALYRIDILERELADLKEEIAAAKKLEALAAHYIDAQGDPAAAP